MSTTKRANRFVWIPIVMAILGGGLGFVGLFNDSVFQISEVQKSMDTAIFKVTVVGRTIYELEVSRDITPRKKGLSRREMLKQNRQRRRDRDRANEDSRTRLRLWERMMIVGFAVSFAMVGAIIAVICNRVVPGRDSES